MLNRTKAATEEFMNAALPVLFAGLNSPSADFQIASHLILSQLFGGSQVAQETTRVVTALLCTKTTDRTAASALPVLALICHNSPTVVFEPEHLSGLMALSGLGARLAEVSAMGIAHGLIKGFLGSCTVHLHREGVPEVCLQFLEAVPLTCAELVASTTVALFERVVDVLADQDMDAAAAAASQPTMLAILRLLSTRYPDAVDSCMVHFSATLTEKRKALVFQVFKGVFDGSRHQPLGDNSSSLLLTLNHPSDGIREQAIRELADAIATPAANHAYIAATALGKLYDSHPPVVEAALDILARKEILPHVEADQLQSYLWTVLVTGRDADDQPVRLPAGIFPLVAAMSHHQPGLLADVLPVLLAALTGDMRLDVAAALPALASAACPLLAGLAKVPVSAGSARPAVGAAVATAVATRLPESTLTGLIGALPDLQDLTAPAAGLIGLALVSGQPEARDDAAFFVQTEQLLAALGRVPAAVAAAVAAPAVVSADTALESALEAALALPEATARTQAALQGLLLALVRSSARRRAPLALLQAGLAQQPYHALLLSLFSTLAPLAAAAGSASFAADLLVLLLAEHLDHAPLGFLAGVIVAPPAALPASTVVAALRLLQVVIATQEAHRDLGALGPVLLVPLVHPSGAVRSAAVDCLAALQEVQAALPKAAHKAARGVVARRGSGARSAAPVAGAGPAVDRSLVLCFSELFPTTTAGQPVSAFLSTKKSAKFLKGLLDARAELAMDASALPAVLGAMLKAPRNNSFKLKVISFLLGASGALAEPFFQATLLRVLGSVDAAFKLPHLVAGLASLEARLPALASLSEPAASALARELFGCLHSAALRQLKEDQRVAVAEALLGFLAPQKEEEAEAEAAGPSTGVRLVLLEAVSKDFFLHHPAAYGQRLFQQVIRLLTSTKDSRLAAGIRAFFGRLSDVNAQFAEAFRGLAETYGAAARRVAQPEAAGAPATGGDSQQELDTVGALLIGTLEAFELRRVILPNNDLVTLLFSLLESAVLAGPSVGGDYLRQLLLSSLLSLSNAFQSLDRASAERRAGQTGFRMDVLVDCIRSSDNPQLHHLALLLMSSIAAIYPENVLSSIMPVFAFMGANVLRQDDNYSFFVIQQTLQFVIPPLVKNSPSLGGGINVVPIKPVIKVFVDALGHIPNHRRVRLFDILASTLGQEQYLYAIFALLLDKLSQKPAGSAAGAPPAADADSLREFCVTLSNSFQPEAQLQALLQLLQLVLSLPNDVPRGGASEGPASGGSSSGSSAGIDRDLMLVDIYGMPARQLRMFKYDTIRFISEVLASRAFLQKFVSRSSRGGAAAGTAAPAAAGGASNSPFEQLFISILESLLSLVDSLGAHLARPMEEIGGPAAVKAFRHINARVYDVINQTNSLLSIPSFLNVVSRLLQHRSSSLRRRTLLLFNQRLLDDSQESHRHKDLFLSMLADVTGVIRAGGADADAVLNVQSALVSLEILIRFFAATEAATFLEVVPVVIAGVKSTNVQVAANSLICLASLCSQLKQQILPFLPQFMKDFLGLFRQWLDSKAAPMAAGGSASGIIGSSAEEGGAVTPASMSAAVAERQRRSSQQYFLRSAIALLEDLLVHLRRSSDLSSQQYFLRSAIALLEDLLVHLPQFLSPYIADTLACCLDPYMLAQVGDASIGAGGASLSSSGADSSELLMKTRRVLQLLGQNLPPRVLLPALKGYFERQAPVAEEASLVAFFHLSRDITRRVLQLLGQNLPPRVLLPALKGYFERQAPVAEEASLVAFFHLSRDIVGHLNRSAVVMFSEDFFGLFLGAVSLRGRNGKAPAAPATDRVEAAAVDMYLELVTKMNESMFRPQLIKFVDWANGIERTPARQLSFYFAVDKMLDRLKSVFIPFLGHVFESMMDLLVSLPESVDLKAGSAAGGANVAGSSMFMLAAPSPARKSVGGKRSRDQLDQDEAAAKTGGLLPLEAGMLLWRRLLSSIHKSLVFDTEGFFEKDRFARILPLLVQQFTSPLLQADAGSMRAVAGETLVPLMGQLAVTVSNDVMWKAINAAVLDLTRAPSIDLRCVAISVVIEMYNRLGEELTILLPETLPYIAELMEDDDEEVLALVHQLSAKMEVFLGEPISKYLR
ncbi:hypothetical protein H696_04344 [Fonticula alba]|uniref:HEAT repeat-containing protein 1 n=1 Tax=Fonticula alba TaxID=691883 RepID=A0A058Z3R3_FONAL|nr:hypothetical protein H696_04344 [Fonticula alba]KCV68924.1 hypothetical protein H696_04344 [Fonticula alba]|eukprot:XP_009496495.1 hypothetical protein H696_04344 [Fonticula alba]